MKAAETVFELFAGICAGGAAAAGVFALITVIGIIPRMAARSQTARRIHGYEWSVIAGGTLGNIWYLVLHHAPEAGVFLPFAGVLEAVFGLAAGVFTGSLVMALAEIVQVFPIMIRRTRLRAGIRFLPAALALGKMAGAFWYFLR